MTYRIAPSILAADFARLGEEIRDQGRKAGLALNPATPLDHLDQVMDRLDVILVMSVNSGFGGQPIALEVDGGIKVANVRALADAGSDTFVAGSAIFGAPDADGGYRGIIAALRQHLSDPVAHAREHAA